MPVMQLTEAAAGVCDLLWMIDGSLPEMREMTDLLNRFGPVVDISGLERRPDPRGAVVAVSSPTGSSRTSTPTWPPSPRWPRRSDLPFHSSRPPSPSPTRPNSDGCWATPGSTCPACFVVTPEQTEATSPRSRPRSAGPRS